MKSICVCMGVWIAAATLCGADDNWPRFRGPTGQGEADSTELPLTWSEQQNVRWKTPIHDKGWSSPVIWDHQIWLTTATEDGKQLSAVCVDSETGVTQYDLKLFEVAKPQYAHPFNSYASPTPVIEEGRVYVTFGSPGTACLDTRTGKVLWKREDLVCNQYRGAGSSPLLVSNLLIMNFDGSDFQYVVALDKNTGKTAWKTNRSIDFQDLGEDGKPKETGDLRKAFSTPVLAHFNGQATILSLGSKALYGYRPTDGAEYWRVEMRECHSGSATPVLGPEDMVYYAAGFAEGQLLALHVENEGPTNQLTVAWKNDKDAPNKSSALLVGSSIFMVSDAGVVSCLNAQTGDVHWRQKIGGHYSASPLAIPGRIYFFSEEGKTTVIEAGRAFRALATNDLADGFMASPAAVGDALFVRTKSCLYRIEKKTGQ